MAEPKEASISPSTTTSQKVTEPTKPSNERLSMPLPFRLPLAILTASASGFMLGAAHGSQISALRFRAENAHRLPTSQVGWYLYHKSKNYNGMLGGIKEGIKMGFKLGFWSGAFFLMEESVDRMRGQILRQWVGFKGRRKHVEDWSNGDIGLERLDGLERMDSKSGVWVQRDFLSTTVAALGTAGLFSAWNRFPMTTMAKTAGLSLKAGIAFGLVQDALSLLRGRRLGYVEGVRRVIFGRRKEEHNALVGAT